MTSIAHSARRTAVKARTSGLPEALTRAGFAARFAAFGVYCFFQSRYRKV